jgi:hypothetical protein
VNSDIQTNGVFWSLVAFYPAAALPVFYLGTGINPMTWPISSRLLHFPDHPRYHGPEKEIVFILYNNLILLAVAGGHHSFIIDLKNGSAATWGLSEMVVRRLTSQLLIENYTVINHVCRASMEWTNLILLAQGNIFKKKHRN